jgi:hypothetical protein
MKNIHVLPTSQPSRLYKNIDNELSFTDIEFEQTNNFNTNQNIYITSDEEIKEGDWYIYLGQIIKRIRKNPRAEYPYSHYQKIILTTDQDLTKDGVQAIDDEFLEWFIKNPSCEEVEVKKECCGQCDERLCEVNDLGRKETKENTFYKIIIPKEEQINCEHCDGDGIYITADSERVECPMCEKGKTPKEELQRGITITHVGKQETLEEAAERLVKETTLYGSQEASIGSSARSYFETELRCVLLGMQYQQEQNKNKYSEGEVIKLVDRAFHMYASSHRHDAREWLVEQFKKK